MRYSFYASERKAKNGKYNRPGTKSNRSVIYHKPDQTRRKSNKIKEIQSAILETRINDLLKKYEKDPEIIQDINSTVSMYVVNLSIARQCKSRSSEKKLTQELNKYLTDLEKR